MKAEIQGRPVSIPENYLDPVTYVPRHVDGNAGHEDCERGVIIRAADMACAVLYCNSRTVQLTDYSLLVWG